MSRISTHVPRRVQGRVVPTLAALALVVAGMALSGCDVTASGPLSTSPIGAPATATATPAASRPASASADTSACPSCTTTSTAGIEGDVVTEGGVQLLQVRAEGESYSPNLFNVKAGVPVRITFTGKAIGCFKRPTFKSLGKTVDISSGSGSIDLGPLKKGSYTWTTSLGISPGTIVAK
jgi:hypothetical protein